MTRRSRGKLAEAVISLWALAALAAVVIGTVGLLGGYEMGFVYVAVTFAAPAFGPVFWIILVV